MAAAITDAGPEGLVERDGALATLAYLPVRHHAG